jgi:4-hydroxythreonine-4-phosphate dehydrogenase
MSPILGITLGDPGGIGPAVVAAALRQIPTPLTVSLFGANALFPLFADITHHHITPIHCADVSVPLVHAPCPHNGAASHAFLTTAVNHYHNGHITHLITAPICKEAWHEAGITDMGHTDALQRLTQTDHVSMAFYTPTLKTILSTIHIPLMEVASHLTPTLLHQTISHAHLFCQQLGIVCPKIAVAGLNPHAGENGLMGSEESWLASYIQSASVKASGPFAPDTLYYRAAQGEFDIVVSLYHDQGLIPIKLIGFHDAVNVTVGLPFIRTSPDHGTAFALARENKPINPSSMIAAIQLALTLTPS